MEHALSKKHFLWGVLFAWAPWLPAVIAFRYFFIGVSNSKATGLAAIAGGIAELLVWWGLAMMIASQVLAIAWLYRSFSRDRWLRNIACALSIGLSGLMLLIVSFFLWAVWFQSKLG